MIIVMLWLYHFKGLVTMFIEYHSEVLLDMIRYRSDLYYLKNPNSLLSLFFAMPI